MNAAYVNITEIDTLINAAADKRFGTRQAAQQRLVELGEAAVHGLVRALKDDDKRRREAAAKALAAIGLPAIPFLMDVMKGSPDQELRWTVACLLAEMKRGEVRQTVRAMTRDQVASWRAKQQWLEQSTRATARKALRQGVVAAGFIAALTSTFVLAAM